MPAHVEAPLNFETRTWYHSDGTARTIRSSSSAGQNIISSMPLNSMSTVNTTNTSTSPSPKTRTRRVNIIASWRDGPIAPPTGDPPSLHPPATPSKLGEREHISNQDKRESHSVPREEAHENIQAEREPQQKQRKLLQAIHEEARELQRAARTREHAVRMREQGWHISENTARSRPTAAHTHNRPKAIYIDTLSSSARPAPVPPPCPQGMYAMAAEPSQVASPAPIPRPVKLIPAAKIIPSALDTTRHNTTPSRRQGNDILVEDQLRRREAIHRAAVESSGVIAAPQEPEKRTPPSKKRNATPNAAANTSSTVAPDPRFDFAAVVAAVRERERARHAARLATAAPLLRENLCSTTLGSSEKHSQSHTLRPDQRVARKSPKEQAKENETQVKEMPETAKEAWDEPGAQWYVTAPTKQKKHAGLAMDTRNGQADEVAPQSWYRPAPKEPKPVKETKGWFSRLH